MICSPRGASALGATPLFAAPELVISCSATDWLVELDGGPGGSDAAVDRLSGSESGSDATSHASGGTMLDPLATLDGGPGGSEGSRDFDEADEPAAWVCTFCTWWESISRSILARSREMRRLARSLMRR